MYVVIELSYNIHNKITHYYDPLPKYYFKRCEDLPILPGIWWMLYSQKTFSEIILKRLLMQDLSIDPHIIIIV